MKLFCLFAGLFLSVGLFAADFSGKVIKVYDGDTIRVEDCDGGKYKIRFADIDAPELSQSYGIESKEYLSSLILDNAVNVHFTNIDVYGRIVGTVYLENGESVNMLMVRSGNAWWYRGYSSDKTFEALEAAAKKKRLGLWKDPVHQPPWEYRKEKKEKSPGSDLARK